MMNPQEIVLKVEAALAGAKVNVKDLTGTRDHFQVTVVSAQFEGKTLVARHRMMYEILHDSMEAQGGGIHALSLNTLAPGEAT
ncbi:MAG: BolA family protein [Deltaproteobacteria bacterium]|nr:BolA family protein [Deltaproteobacteria bacterium]